MPPFELQGHRGARGLLPENTLPSFEIALDVGVTSIETDVHLTHDGVPVLYHDPAVSPRICRSLPGSTAPEPERQLLISTLTLEQLRGYRADRNPNPVRFPLQQAVETPVARLYANLWEVDPYTLPTVNDLFAFVKAYAAELGQIAGKTAAQRERASRLRFDLEIKRVPFRPEFSGDHFDGTAPGLIEQRLLEVIRIAGMLDRTQVRSFDHRSVRVLRQQEPRLVAAVLIAETSPMAPAELVRQADAQIYCPDFTFLDLAQVRLLHAAGVRVIPWTVNEPADWQRLLDWGVDGITTDYPDRLAEVLRERGIAPGV